MTIKQVILYFIITFCNIAYAQTPISNNYRDEAGLPQLKIERTMIYAPVNNWLYNHHAAIIEFKGKLIAT